MSSPLPTSLPFGIRDIKLTRYTDGTATVLDTTVVDLPVARTLSFTEAEDFTDLEGDDELAATHGSGPHVEFDVESGGISFYAWSVFSGGTVTESGVAPNRIRRIRKNTSQERPYFKAEGQSMSDSGGDLHCVIWRAKVTDNIEGEFANGEFMMTSCSGKGLGSKMPSNEGDLYDFVQNETATEIMVLAGPAGIVAGTITANSIEVNWDDLVGATSYQVQYKKATDTGWTTFGTEPTASVQVVSGLTALTAYNFRVRGRNSTGALGSWSTTLNATTV